MLELENMMVLLTTQVAFARSGVSATETVWVFLVHSTPPMALGKPVKTVVTAKRVFQAL